jgi:uncharacterized protein YjbJ (UPF0337 family)
MDKAQFAEMWAEIRPEVKAQWSRLTDEELDQVQGDPDSLISLLVEKYEEPRQAIALQLKHLVERHASVR